MQRINVFAFSRLTLNETNTSFIIKPMDNNFINIKLESYNLDTYFIRTSIFNYLKDTLPQFKGNLLDIGCGKMPYRKYILENTEVNNYVGLDIEGALDYDSSIKPDYTWNGEKMPFNENSFDCAFATEVLEHCPQPETVLKEVFRVLKPNGIFFFTVPFLWNLHEVPHDEYRYTPFSLERHLKNSSFTSVTIKATGGWNSSLAQMLGLWVRRKPMLDKKRKILSYVLKPIIQILINRDIKPNKFEETTMITGLYGTAIK
jgi:SAM-dependent methyltransferase